jgi:hypothetical protein
MKANEIKEQTLELIQQRSNKITLPIDEDRIGPHDLSIIPVSTQKTPFSAWKLYQKEYAPYKQWREHYCNGGFIGIICGEISNNLECIDIDLKNDPLA